MIETLQWLGSQEPYLDTPHIERCGPVVLGCYGGTTSANASKNEDAALVWSAPNRLWECGLIVDAHHSAQSADLLIETFAQEASICDHILSTYNPNALDRLREHLITVLRSKQTKQRCQNIQGEASCLFMARHSEFIMWISIGDCMSYLFHPGLTRFGQYGLNQRVFYQWVGKVNTFDRAIACYSTGTQLLQPGKNTFLMLTDGLLEFNEELMADPRLLHSVFSAPEPLERRAEIALHLVKEAAGRDSATLLAWEFDPVSLFTLP